MSADFDTSRVIPGLPEARMLARDIPHIVESTGPIEDKDELLRTIARAQLACDTVYGYLQQAERELRKR